MHAYPARPEQINFFCVGGSAWVPIMFACVCAGKPTAPRKHTWKAHAAVSPGQPKPCATPLCSGKGRASVAPSPGRPNAHVVAVRQWLAGNTLSTQDWLPVVWPFWRAITSQAACVMQLGRGCLGTHSDVQAQGVSSETLGLAAMSVAAWRHMLHHRLAGRKCMQCH